MFAKKHYCLVLSILMLIGLGGSAIAGTSSDRVWHQIDDTEISRRPAQRTRTPQEYGTFKLDKANLETILSAAPEEFTQSSNNTVLEIPMPGGGFAKFSIVHSLVVEPGLAAKYPELGRTYSGQGLDDPTATVRLDFLPTGFHAMILSPNGTVMIDPYAVGDTENYVSFFKRDLPKMDNWRCEPGPKGFESIYDIDKFQAPDASTNDVTSGTTLRTYRLALSADHEYTAAVGGNTIAGSLAAMVLIMNRVNGVYERDLAIRMVMIANNNLIVYASDQLCGGVACTNANDPYTDNDGVTMLSQNQTNTNTVIGAANYDIGHVFSTGGGGVASLAVPCGASKAQGVTGLPNPVGDAFAIDYVAHEMGHQWSSNHTFNGNVSNCGGGNRSSTNSYEPGSGITVMAYAGICGNQDLAPHSIDTFHVRSLEAIVTYSQVNNGNTCSAQTATNNTPPTVTAVTAGPYNIPKQTPFALTASASDVNGDTVTFDWQQYNAGGAAGAATLVPNDDTDGVARPLFRNYAPTVSGTRYFPSLTYILNNANVPPATLGSCPAGPCLLGERMSSMTRTMNFQVVARDNRVNGGGINSATVAVNVDAGSGPFAVTAPNAATTFAGNSTQTILWSVANTTAAPVSAANVKISFSSDGGQTFPTVLAASTPNDGSQTVTIPNIATTTGRIKIEGENNIFFDINDANFTVTASVANVFRAPFDYDGDDKTDLSIFRPSPGEWWYQKSSTGTVAAAAFGSSSDKIVPADFTGDNKTDFAFWRPSTGQWFVLRSEDFSFFAFPFGTTGDTPVTGDFDGDGKADPTIFRPSTLTWFIQKSTGGTDIVSFGSTGDKPVIGDYDGDGKADIAIYRPSAGQWWIRRSSTGVVFAAAFGSTADKPVQGYFTADNKTDMAFWRPSTGEWFVLRSEDFSFYSFPFGTSTDIPAPGDYDGDDRFDAAVFRPSTSTWFVQRSTAGTLIQAFGASSDLPTPNAYVP